MLRPRIALACVLLVAVGAPACSGDDSAGDTTAVASTTTTSEPTSTSTSTAPTTTAPTTTATTSATTAPTTTVPPTTSVEDLKAFIASEYLRTRQLARDMLREPSLDNLESRAADIGAPGSAYYTALIAEVQDLVRLGDVYRPNEPEISFAEIREVRLEGQEPYTHAVVRVCDVSNDIRVNLGEFSPSGSDSPYADTGELRAWLIDVPLTLTDSGWVQTQAQFDGEIWEGSYKCLA